MRIGHKLSWAFALVVIAIVITAAFCLRTFWHIDQNRRAIKDEVMPNVRQTMTLYEHLVGMDHWIAAYLLSGESSDYREAESTFRSIQTLCREHRDELLWPKDTITAEKLIEQVEQYMDIVFAMAALKREGTDTRRIIELKGIDYHARMNQMLDAQVKQRRALLSEINNLQDQLDIRENIGWWFVSVATAAVSLLVVGTGFLVTRAITLPVHRMERTVERLSQGDLNARMNVGTRDELGQLARAFDRMAANLQESTVSIDQLNQEIAERRRTEKELDVARQQADTANQAKSQFLANVSHEIRTPLNAIITMARMLNQRDTQHLSERQREGLEIVHWSSQQLLSLINSVLDLSKIEAGRVESNITRAPLAPILSGLVHMGEALIKDKPIALTLEAAPDLPDTIVTDEQKLKIILTNIVGNAVKFTERGSVTLRVTCVDKLWTFAVTDTGVGIAPEHLDAIFEEFTQGDGSTTRRFPGTGLGLAIAKRLADQLQGDISARSTPGQGSTFTVYLPQARQAPPPIAAETTAPGECPPVSPRTRVLIAEDDEYGRAALRLLLSDRCELTLANDGRDAVTKARREAPEIIFLDIMMPEMDGYQAYTEIRKHDPEIPIIALTAKAMADDRDKLLAYGFTDYLPKPIDEDTLMALIARYAGRARTQDSEPRNQ
jgi:signal transduction histidine kinase/ActR/RegA family two-component response regulator